MFPKSCVSQDPVSSRGLSLEAEEETVKRQRNKLEDGFGECVR